MVALARTVKERRKFFDRALNGKRVGTAQEYLDVTFLLGKNRDDLVEVNLTIFPR